MKNKFSCFGVMIDASRNAVMTPDMMKRYLPILKRMGYNCLFLYTEDTYYVEGEPYFGYMRGRYSEEEMRNIDAYAAGLGIEVIPCIQTLAHLKTTLRWGQLPIDCDDILLTDDERTYEFIDRMFASLSKNFRSRKIHVGMDEAHMLGRGRHMDIHGAESISEIMKRHLGRVCEIAERYGYEVMLWSDMYMRAFNQGKYYIKEYTKVPKDIIDAVPENAVPVYWDYYNSDESIYDMNFDAHRQISKKTWFAGGAWSWSGFMPHNSFSITAMKAGIRSAIKNKVKNVFITMWGDDGGECSKLAVLPSLFAMSEFAKGNEDMSVIKEKFKRLIGMDYDDFMLLDELNYVDSIDADLKNKKVVNPCKYMLFSDYFNGFLDVTVRGDVREKYEALADRLYSVSRKSRKYGYIFRSAAKLASALAVKYELGVKTRRAYQQGDLAMLKSLAEQDYPEAERRIKDHALAFEKQWFYENKPCGFDVQDIRFGAIIRRTESCRRRIMDYVNGIIDGIPELEEELLPVNGTKGESISCNHFSVYMTTNSQW